MAAADLGGHVGRSSVGTGPRRPVTDYFKTNIEPWLSDPVVIKAINDQNATHAGLCRRLTWQLDKKWRAETKRAAIR